MSNVTVMKKQDIILFGDNEVRLEIICNSLRMFANENQVTTGSPEEAEALARFFESELPEMMRQISMILTNAIRTPGKNDHEVTAALEIMREDHERLNQLVSVVIDGLQSAARSPDQAGHTALRQAISAYLAALRSHMEWSRNIVLKKQP